jgi:hypothetical protein
MLNDLLLYFTSNERSSNMISHRERSKWFGEYGNVNGASQRKCVFGLKHFQGKPRLYLI